MWIKGFKFGDKILKNVNHKSISSLNTTNKNYHIVKNDGNYKINVEGDYNFN